VSGIRVLGRTGAPIAVGLRLAGHDLIIDDVEVEGSVDTGVDILNDGAILVRSSRFSSIDGQPIRIGPAATPQLRQNVFRRGPARPGTAALDVAASAAPRLTANLFLGYGETEAVKLDEADAAGPRARELLKDNYLIKSQDHGR